MMEKRFRAWSIAGQSFIYFGIDDVPSWVHPAEAEMFTGRNDKKKQKIYEGDICKFTGHSYLAVVVYEPRLSSFGFDSRTSETINNPDAFMMWDDCEVVGNIYENPDLILQNLPAFRLNKVK